MHSDCGRAAGDVPVLDGAIDMLGWACLGFGAAGFGWGYLAGATRSLDFLQPGRHTYAFFTALAVAGGAALDELLTRLRALARASGSTAGPWPGPS